MSHKCLSSVQTTSNPATGDGDKGDDDDDDDDDDYDDAVATAADGGGGWKPWP